MKNVNLNWIEKIHINYSSVRQFLKCCSLYIKISSLIVSFFLFFSIFFFFFLVSRVSIYLILKIVRSNERWCERLLNWSPHFSTKEEKIYQANCESTRKIEHRNAQFNLHFIEIAGFTMGKQEKANPWNFLKTKICNNANWKELASETVAKWSILNGLKRNSPFKRMLFA